PFLVPAWQWSGSGASFVCRSTKSPPGNCVERLGKLGNGDMNAVTYDDVHIDFTWEEWTLLNPSQKNLYKDVMLETYTNLTIIGYTWEDHDIENHSQWSRRYER
ncbi:Zinc finger protein 120, partial [Lemmus lemmus]